MKHARLWLAASLFAALGCTSTPPATQPGPQYALTHQERLPLEEQNYAYRWLDITQEVGARDVDRNGARPTVLSRQMMIWAVAMYDAWAAYDPVAVGTRLGGALRRPLAEHTLANKNKAVSYASYRALLGVFPGDAEYLRDQMRAMGYDPSDASTDTSTPQGVGNVAAAAVLAYRRNDGANQFGDEPGSNGAPYSDFTHYQPVNPPDRIVDPDRWQPIPFTRADGSQFTPGFLTPHWYRCKPMVLLASDQFRAEPPRRRRRTTPSCGARPNRCSRSTRASRRARRRSSSSCATVRVRPARADTGCASRRTSRDATRTISTAT